MNSFGVPVGISEDWDRPDRMKTNSAVSGIGSEVLNNTDVAQLHVMPYCTALTFSRRCGGGDADEIALD